jgi:DNA-3-methyladenine glycosylase I
LDAFLWTFKPKGKLVAAADAAAPIAQSKESQLMSKALKKYGLKFVGPTICYAFMQAVGIVNDHSVKCFRRHACTTPSPSTSH